MKLRIATPTDVIAEADKVKSVVAEDDTGSFGVLPGHTDFLTVLGICVVTWRDERDSPHFVAVRNGVFEVADGDTVRISTRDAVTGPDLEVLRTKVLARFRESTQANVGEHARAVTLHAAAMRQIRMLLDPRGAVEVPSV